jgi:zinc D-Ala-D-Ala carboxypeptidase
MNLSANFTLKELTKSDTATRLGLDNTPDDVALENLKTLCEKVLQPVRDHFGKVCYCELRLS